MAFRQKYNPNVRVGAKRGWCLKYVDDAGNAPTRRPTAKAAYEAERKAKRLRTSTPPVGLWVVGFFSFGRVYQNYGHIVFMKNLGNGRYEIRDSETNAGARSVYTSITSVKQWFAAYAPTYIGWSTHCDGRQYVEEYTPKKSNDAVATEIVAGKGGWGNGPTRVARLKKAGYNPTTVQNLVNKKMAAKNKPKAVYYTVKRGDTLSAIASRHKTTWQSVQKLNKLKNPNLIKPGQRLRVK